MCLGQSLSDVMVHQYIGVQANQEKLPRKCWNFTFLMGGHLMHFNLSVFSLFLTVLLKWNYYALASQYIDHWSIQGHFQINIFIDFKNHPTFKHLTSFTNSCFDNLFWMVVWCQMSSPINCDHKKWHLLYLLFLHLPPSEANIMPKLTRQLPSVNEEHFISLKIGIQMVG